MFAISNRAARVVLLGLTTVATGFGLGFEPDAGPSGGFDGKLVVELRGTDLGEMRMIGGVMMNCFDIDLVDVATGEVIGTGTDCLDLASISGGDPMKGEGFAVSNTTIFNFPHGTLTTQNRTTVQPVVEGSPGRTHITGDLAGQANVQSGTGQLSGVTGIARLHGAVDMSRFFTDNIASFNCLFVLDLDRP